MHCSVQHESNFRDASQRKAAWRRKTHVHRACFQYVPELSSIRARCLFRLDRKTKPIIPAVITTAKGHGMNKSFLCTIHSKDVGPAALP